jgi:hypothetical protein
MAKSLDEIVQQSGEVLNQIRNHPRNWKLAISWIVITVVVCWLGQSSLSLLKIESE